MIVYRAKHLDNIQSEAHKIKATNLTYHLVQHK